MTQEQQKLLAWALGDGTDFPQITHDPYVNYLVDCSVMGDMPESKGNEYDPSLYSSEEELKGCACETCIKR